MASTNGKICLIGMTLAFFSLLIVVFYVFSQEQSVVDDVHNELTRYLSEKPKQTENTIHIPNMEEISFLHPDISVCEDIFEMGARRDDIKYIYDELDLYEKRVNGVVKTLRQQGKKSFMEGYSSKNAEEAFVMAKLAK